MITGSGYKNPVKPSASPIDARMVYSFVRIIPCPDRETLWLNNSQADRFVDDAMVRIHQTIEINARPCPSNGIVRLTFVGFVEVNETIEGE